MVFLRSLWLLLHLRSNVIDQYVSFDSATPPETGPYSSSPWCKRNPRSGVERTLSAHDTLLPLQRISSLYRATNHHSFIRIANSESFPSNSEWKAPCLLEAWEYNVWELAVSKEDMSAFEQTHPWCNGRRKFGHRAVSVSVSACPGIQCKVGPFMKTSLLYSKH